MCFGRGGAGGEAPFDGGRIRGPQRMFGGANCLAGWKGRRRRTDARAPSAFPPVPLAVAACPRVKVLAPRPSLAAYQGRSPSCAQGVAGRPSALLASRCVGDCYNVQK